MKLFLFAIVALSLFSVNVVAEDVVDVGETEAIEEVASVSGVVEKVADGVEKAAEKVAEVAREVKEKVKKEEKVTYPNTSVKGLAFVRQRTDIRSIEAQDQPDISMYNNSMLLIGSVDVTGNASPWASAHIRMTATGAANLVTVPYTSAMSDADLIENRPGVVFDHIFVKYKENDLELKAGMMSHRASAVKENYFSVLHRELQTDAYRWSIEEYYNVFLRGTLYGVAGGYSFNENYGLSLAVTRSSETGMCIKQDSDYIVKTRDDVNLMLELPIKVNKFTIIPEGIIGFDSSLTNLSAGMDISMSLGGANRVFLNGAVNLNDEDNLKNALFVLGTTYNLYQSGDFAFIPTVRLSGSVQTDGGLGDISDEGYLGGLFDLQLMSRYKGLGIRPRYRYLAFPNYDLDERSKRHRIDFDVMVAF